MSSPRYRSKLEGVVALALGSEWAYEPFRVPYVTHRTYCPDFVYQVKGNHQILVEVKGFFRVGDTAKYKAIRDTLAYADLSEGPRQELVFFLSNPRTKVRKGSKMNMGEWCTKEDFIWFDDPKALKHYGRER